MVSPRKQFWHWWYRSGIAIRLALFAFFSVILIILLNRDYYSNGSKAFSGNVAVFSLVNLNIAVLCILILLVGRNIVKLLFDRKRNLLGSKLRFRLVAAFMGLTGVPAILLVIVASGLLSKALDGWFSSPAESSVEAAKEVGRIHFRLLRNQTLQVARRLSLDLQSRQAMADSQESLKSYFEQQRVAERLFTLELYDHDLNQIIAVHNAAAHIERFLPPKIETEDFKQALAGEIVVRDSETESSEFIRAYASLIWKGSSSVLVVTYRIDSELSEALQNIGASYKEYLQLQRFENPLRANYILTLYILAGLVLFAAMWFGIFIARQLTGPIQQLAGAMREVARGNYNIQLPQSGDDEIGFLTKTYNQMAKEVAESITQAERRQVYLETVLTNLAVGVIVLGTDERVVSVNSAAKAILATSQSADDNFEGQLLAQILPEALKAEVNQLLTIVRKSGNIELGGRERQIECMLGGRERKLLCTAGLLRTKQGEELGTVLLIDDVTALSEAQRLAAWREAARRIAHEIKNPLTPIKLAAQRLQRAFAEDLKSGKMVDEAGSTIVEHVDSIKRLADEFSRFARMPTAQLESVDLNNLIRDVVSAYAVDEQNITFQCITDENLGLIQADPEQLRRLLMNLIENSIRAITAESDTKVNKTDFERPKIIVKTEVNQDRGLAIIEVIDNGPGIAPEDRSKVFEPYFSRSKEGTGLGLAIVAAIVTEHGGQVRLSDNNNNIGIKVVVTLPMKLKEATQRKFDITVAS